MQRQIKYYPPEKRRYLQNNLQCQYCGNTTAFFIDIRLRHQVTVDDQSQILVEMDNRIVKHVLKGIEKNAYALVDKGVFNENQVIKCANCIEGMVDIQERLLDYCWQMGCPGCETCGEYISKEDLINFCHECITEHKGAITEDDCYLCMPSLRRRA